MKQMLCILINLRAVSTKLNSSAFDVKHDENSNYKQLIKFISILSSLPVHLEAQGEFDVCPINTTSSVLKHIDFIPPISTIQAHT